MHRRVWFDRRFVLGMPPEAFPDVMERLRGTPLRLGERTSGLSDRVLKERVDGRWSIQEHAGHLGDLEELWLGRLDDFAHGRSTLRPADLDNRMTWDAGHDSRALSELLARFEDRRGRMIARLDDLGEDRLRVTANHPRLEQPMTVVDLCFFVAEHDDHHLAAITELRSVDQRTLDV